MHSKNTFQNTNIYGERMEKDEKEREHLLDIIKEVMNKELKIKSEKIFPNARLIEDLGLDSLDYLSLVISLEKKIQSDYKIRNFEIPADVPAKIYTIQDTIDALYGAIKKYRR